MRWSFLIITRKFLRVNGAVCGRHGVPNNVRHATRRVAGILAGGATTGPGTPTGSPRQGRGNQKMFHSRMARLFGAASNRAPGANARPVIPPRHWVTPPAPLPGRLRLFTVSGGCTTG